MNKNLFYIAVAVLGMFGAASCIEESLDACPPEGGGVTVRIYAEKFQARAPYAPEELEGSFNARIHSLGYLLYAGDRLIEQGTLDGVAATADSAYVFRHDTLPFGRYRLALLANTEARMTAGTSDAPEKLFVVYQGEEAGDDHFTQVLPFEVMCPYRNEFTAVLQRVHGVARFRFDRLPAHTQAVEVSLDHVASRTPLTGDGDTPREVVKRVEASALETRAGGAFTLGTFATVPGSRSTWRVRLYGTDPATPFYDRVVTDTLRIERNQLLDLVAEFDEGSGDFDFSVDLDTRWDGSVEGGGSDLTPATGR